MGPSQDFKDAFDLAIARLMGDDFHPGEGDDAQVFMAQQIPVFLDSDATSDQAAAAGCVSCKYLGLWAPEWPGYAPTSHGTIWLFENGMRMQYPDLVSGMVGVLQHEMDHALQRDHVLEALEQARMQGWTRSASGLSVPSGCGCPGG